MNIKSSQTILAAVLGVLLSSGISVVRADDTSAVSTPGAAPAAPGEKAAKPWKNSTDASVVSTNGNSKATTTSVKDTYDYNWKRTGLEVAGGGFGSSSGQAVTAEQYFGNEKVTYNFSDRNYVYEKMGWNKDRFAGIANRWEGSAGLGRVLIDSKTDKLNLEAGPGYVNEERIDAPRNDFSSGRVYLKYVHAFSPTASFSQDGEYLHDFSDSNDFRINTETALTATLTSHIALKSSFIWNRVNMPPPGAVKDDTKVMAGLLITY